MRNTKASRTAVPRGKLDRGTAPGAWRSRGG